MKTRVVTTFKNLEEACRVLGFTYVAHGCSAKEVIGRLLVVPQTADEIPLKREIESREWCAVCSSADLLFRLKRWGRLSCPVAALKLAHAYSVNKSGNKKAGRVRCGRLAAIWSMGKNTGRYFMEIDLVLMKVSVSCFRENEMVQRGVTLVTVNEKQAAKFEAKAAKKSCQVQVQNLRLSVAA